MREGGEGQEGRDEAQLRLDEHEREPLRESGPNDR